MSQAFLVSLWDVSKHADVPTHQASFEIRGGMFHLYVEPLKKGSRRKTYQCAMSPSFALKLAKFIWGCAKELGAK
jgi:hypothetical protein